MRLVFDTSVIVAALRSGTGASYRLLQLVPSGQVQMIATASLLFEYEEVLSRSEQIAVQGRSQKEIQAFLIAMADSIGQVHLDFRYRPQLLDPDDEMVLEAAINGQAEAIVTHNVRDFLPVARRFGIDVSTPARIIVERLKL